MSLYSPLFQFSSVTRSCPTLCDPMNCSTPGLPVHHQLPELTQTHVHRVSDVIQPSHPLWSSSPPAFNLSQHQGFSSESAFHIRWPSYQSFSFSISLSSECSGLISFRMDCLVRSSLGKKNSGLRAAHFGGPSFSGEQRGPGKEEGEEEEERGLCLWSRILAANSISPLPR